MKPKVISKAFDTIDEAQAAFPTPEQFRIALVDEVHFGGRRFVGLKARDLMDACGIRIGDVDEFCLSQVPSNWRKFRAGDTGWSFIYTYRILGKNRCTVRFKSEHGDGGVCDSCIGPYLYRRKLRSKKPAR